MVLLAGGLIRHLQPSRIGASIKSLIPCKPEAARPTPRHAAPNLAYSAPLWPAIAAGTLIVAAATYAGITPALGESGPTHSSSVALAEDSWQGPIVSAPINLPLNASAGRSNGPTATASQATGSMPISSTSATTPVNAELVSSLAANGIPSVALAAYQHAAAQYDAVAPSCKLTWPLLAAIGRVESNHGQFAGAILHTDGTSTPRIIGIPLNGNGTAVITATTLGVVLDGDPKYDHAVGPMQIIPSTWSSYALAATGHTTADPFNIFDAAATAARYLCVAGGDLSTLSGQQRAVLAYNHSDEYLSTVLSLEAKYAATANIAVPAVPAGPTTLPTQPSLPAANPGPPPVLTDPATPSASPSTSDTNAPSSNAPTTGADSPTSSTRPANQRRRRLRQVRRRRATAHQRHLRRPLGMDRPSRPLRHQAPHRLLIRRHRLGLLRRIRPTRLRVRAAARRFVPYRSAEATVHVVGRAGILRVVEHRVGGSVLDDDPRRALRRQEERAVVRHPHGLLHVVSNDDDGHLM